MGQTHWRRLSLHALCTFILLQDVSDAAKEVGLELHPDKTKILHNSVGYGVGAKAAEIRNMTIEILDKIQKALYLGHMLKPTEMQGGRVEEQDVEGRGEIQHS